MASRLSDELFLFPYSFILDLPQGIGAELL